MKKLLSFFITVLLLTHSLSFAEEAQPTQTQEEYRKLYGKNPPDFSPPKDLSGPVFPLEDVIPEPNQDTNRFLTEFVNMLATLGLIISLILIVAWFLKRMLNTRQEQANTTSLIKVLERRALSPKTALYLIEVEGKSIIISESQNGVTHLANYNSPEDEEIPELPSAFSKLLNENKTPPNKN